MGEEDIIITLNEKEYAIIERAASLNQCSIEDFIINSALEAAKEDIG